MTIPCIFDVTDFNSPVSCAHPDFERMADELRQNRLRAVGLEGFWSYAKERIIKHHGVSPQGFPLYLKELEFRYNHRKEDILSLTTKFLCDLVPKRRQSPKKNVFGSGGFRQEIRAETTNERGRRHL